MADLCTQRSAFGCALGCHDTPCGLCGQLWYGHPRRHILLLKKDSVRINVPHV